MTRNRRRTTDNAYNWTHRRLRAQVAKQVAAGAAVCWRCRRRIAPIHAWDLGHLDVPGAKARGLYAGPEHRHCSRVAGGHKRRGRRPPLVRVPATRTKAPALAVFDA